MSIGRGISAAVMLSGGDGGGEGRRERDRGGRQMERCGDCGTRLVAQVASHAHFANTSQWHGRKYENVQLKL